MSNRLSMAQIHSIETLHDSQHSNREIARLLGIDRGTVNAYVQQLKAAQAVQNRPGHRPQVGPQTGRDEVQNRPNPQTGSLEEVADQNRPGHRPQVGPIEKWYAIQPADEAPKAAPAALQVPRLTDSPAPQ